MPISLRAVKALMEKVVREAPNAVQISRDAVKELASQLELEAVETTRSALRRLEEDNSIRRYHGVSSRKRLKAKDLQVEEHG